MLFAGQHLSNCSSIAPCLVAVHAETNAIAFAARHGVATDGAELHVTLSPCVTCSHHIINSGIARVVYGVVYRDESGLNILENAGVALEALR